jgi:LuxR family quorum-sensing system transcriptional regulator CciR
MSKQFVAKASRFDDRASFPTGVNRGSAVLYRPGEGRMDRVKDFDQFIDRMRAAPDLESLWQVMCELTALLGFRQFALGHHVDLVRPPTNAIRLTNYDPSWIAETLERRFFADDPVHAVNTRLVRPFVWTELSEHIKLTALHQTILDRAGRFGLIAGVTIPVRLAGEYEGSCSFATDDYAKVHPLGMALSSAAAQFAFEGARRLMRLRDGRRVEPVPGFTTKQREMLILVGRGKTDAEIAEVMGISRSTAHEHVEAGRRAYGNAQRTLMVIRAVFDGVITFADIFRR